MAYNLGVIVNDIKLLLQPDVVFNSASNGCNFSSLAPPGGEQGWAIGLESHGICVPGHEFRDLGLILLGRFGLGQISLGQSRDKNLRDSRIQSFGTTSDFLGLVSFGIWSTKGSLRQGSTVFF